MKLLSLIIISFITISISAQSGAPLSVTGSKELAERDALIAPYVVKARRQLNKFHKAYNKKKDPTAKYYAVIRLYDSDGKYDQVYLEVRSWDGDRLTGRITNTLKTATQYKKDQVIDFKEDVILDWLIQYANGKEKGNYVGNFLKGK